MRCFKGWAGLSAGCCRIEPAVLREASGDVGTQLCEQSQQSVLYKRCYHLQLHQIVPLFDNFWKEDCGTWFVPKAPRLCAVRASLLDTLVSRELPHRKQISA